MRADQILNPIERLTPAEKERLGFLIMWALDGPEQGMLNYNQWIALRSELRHFLQDNGIPAAGQWCTMKERA
jgi:hypothetical protein